MAFYALIDPIALDRDWIRESRPNVHLSQAVQGHTPLHVSVWDSTLNSEDLFAHDKSWFSRAGFLRIHAGRDKIESITLAIRGQPWIIGGSIYIPPEFLGRQAPFLRNLTFTSVSPIPVTNLPPKGLTLEILNLSFQVQSTTEVWRLITLSKLRLAWENHGGPLSLISCLVAPELKDSTIRVTPAHTAISLPSYPLTVIASHGLQSRQ